MRIKKIMPIIIALIIILNTLIPTIVLSANEIEEIKGKDNDTIIDNNTNKTDNEGVSNKNNITENEIKDNKENNTSKNENNVDEKINKEENIVKNDTEGTNENINNDQEETINNNIDEIQKEENTEELVSIQSKELETGLTVSYRTHVQDEGWQNYVQNGEMAGTSGKSLRLEAMNIKLLNNEDKNLHIKYQVHVQDEGWQNWRTDGEMAGTSGKSLRLEAIRILLDNSEDYSIMYRVHVQDEGWQDWRTDGEMAGTSGKSLRLEAIQIKIIKKQRRGRLHIDTPVNGSTYYDSEASNITVSGWKMANVSNTNIKAYVDGKEIDSKTIQYYERKDVINEIIEYGTNGQNPTPGYSFNIDISKFNGGSHTIKIELYYDNTVLTTTNTTFNFDKNLHVQYMTHVQDEGWQDWKKDGEVAGTSGKSLRLEAMNIKLLNNANSDIHVKYQVHVQDEGWQNWRTDGEMAGTSGKSLRLEAIRILLDNSEDYAIMYRVHVQDEGWQDWRTDGEIAGTSGKSLRLEAIQIKIVKKTINSIIKIETPSQNTSYYAFENPTITVSGWKMANVSNTQIKAYVDNKEIEPTTIQYYERPDIIKSNTNYGTEAQNVLPGYKFDIDINNLEGENHTIKVEMYYNNSVIASEVRNFNIDINPHISYSAHVEDIGWQDYVKDGEIIGTVGKSLRVEALKIKLVNVPSTAHIKYRVYIYGKGWQDYVQDGEIAGTTGKNRMIEAIQIEIEGLEKYTVEYQAHVQDIGWQVWALNGMNAGTIEQGLRIESARIRIVKKENTVVPQVKYSSHNATNGWTSYVKNGNTSGSENNAIKLDAIKIALENSETASIKYKVHIQEVGWTNEVQNNEQAGTGESVNGIEAIQMQVSGLSGYSIEYRVYVIGKGWQDWACDGEIAGTTGKSLQVSAIQIRIKIKTDNNRSNFSVINTSKYKGYKDALQKLQQQHPNWTIKLVYTGLKWDDVLDAEQGRDSKGEPFSLTQEKGNWRDSSDNNSYQGEWYKASREAIAYMMDPRNSLDQYYVFQFQNLARSSNETVQKVSTMTNGTYLQNYSSTLVSASQSYNVSAFHLASRMLMEQGTSGWSINGYSYKGRMVYNYANIGATGNTIEDIMTSGAKYAYENKWFSPEFCINGTAQWIYNNYLSNGQNTKYFEKYNVVKPPFYTHQYMQNIRAANDEGYNTAKSLEKNGLLNSSYEFLIPVYEEMPDTACIRP